MTVKNQMKRMFKAIAVLLLLSSAPLFAQNPNMITNGEFETNGGYTSQYQRTYGANVVEAGHYAIDNTTANHGGGGGWPTLNGSTGRFMLVNGLGGSENPTTVVWTTQQPISVVNNTYYTFSCKVVNLNVVVQGQINPAKLQLKINGEPVGAVNQLPSDNNWHTWTVEWYSGNANQAVIQIVDMYTNSSGLGDDYALDNMVFKLHDGYSLEANGFTVSYCGETTPISIDLSGHYDMSYPSSLPNGNNSPSMQVKIRKADYYTWSTNITTYHGAASVGSGNIIQYTPNEGFYGQDSFQYQISRFGLESYATITIDVGAVPSNCTPQGLPTLICISDVSSFNPSATWDPIETNITSGWQYKKVGVTDWQESYTFQNWVQQWGGVGEYSIRFFAQNSCTGNGFVYSEPFNFNICDIPVLNWGSNSPPSTICTGSEEPLVSIITNYNICEPTWQYKRGNNNWENFGCDWGSFDLQEGDQVRFLLNYNACSGSPLILQPSINVVSGPVFNTTNVTSSFASGYYCPGSQVTLPPIQPNWYQGFGMVDNYGWYYVNYNPSGSPTYEPISGSTITLNESKSVTPCLYSSQCGGLTPFFPAFDLVVWDGPSIQGLENLPDSLGPVCSGTTLSSILPELSPGGHYLDNGFGWEISSGQSQTGFSSNLPTQLSPEYNGRWIRYHVQKDCTLHNDAFSDPIRLWVGAAPTLNTSQIEPFGTVCDRTLVASLGVDVHVTNWNLFHNDESFEGWEVYLNGTWTGFTQFELNYDGCQVRYRAYNECGESIVTAGVVHVTEGPSFNTPGEPLDFADYYCDGEYLTTPTPPSFDPHGINVNDNYWAYFDGIEYNRIYPTSPPQLDENWNGNQITYVLESDCGGEIYYPTPHTLVVKGNPVVHSIALNGSTTFCVGTPISLNVDIDWHLCTQNEASSWQYAPADQPYNYFNFNPIAGIPEAGTFLVNYHAVANECYFDAICSNPLTVTVEAAPEFVNPDPLGELDRFCEGDPLALPEDPGMVGHVEDSTWQISETTDQYGAYRPIPGDVLTLTLGDDGRWLRYYAIGCNVPLISNVVEIHVDGKPWEEYSIVESICKGQRLSPQLENSNDYPVTQREWKREFVSSGEVVFFEPDEDTFDEEGDYRIYYRVGNSCGWYPDDDFEGPFPLNVTAGPEFDNSTLPPAQYVCEGTTVGELLSGITPPSLVDPDVPHDSLGWYISDQPVELSTVITESNHGDELRYGVSSVVCDAPVYSSGILLHVYGRPVVTQMPSIDWEFCDGDDASHLPDPVINDHNGGEYVTGQWQLQSQDGSWGNLPTTWNAGHNGAQIRYHLEHTECSNLSYDSQSMMVSVYTAPIINDDDLPTNNLITICTGGPLGIDEPDVYPEQNVSFWQVSANGTDWSTALEGHTFYPDHVNNFFDGMYLRYHAESTRCPNLVDDSEIYTIQLFDSPSINDNAWPKLVQYCSGGSLGIDVPSGLPGEWQVSVDGTNWDAELEGHPFDQNHIDDFFDGKLLRYFVHSSCGDAVSKVLTLRLMAAINMPIIGETQVAMMNSFWPGIYDYYVDSTTLVQPVVWWLEGADWRLDTLGMARCLVYVNSIGTAVLHARVTNELCSNDFEVTLPINATYFGVEEDDAKKVEVYPNPTRNTVTIEAEGIESIRLINMMGQVLEMHECNGLDSVVLNLNGYTPSVYLLEIKTVNGTAKKRLILSR